MGWMNELIEAQKRRQDEKATQTALDREMTIVQRDKTRKQASDLNSKMHEKYCPIIKGNCTATCIHFSPANIQHFAFDGTNSREIIRAPSCRLWG